MTVQPKRGFRLKRPSTATLIGLLIVSAITPVSSNPVLTFACGVTAFLLFFILSRPGEPPVMLFALGVQWLQIATKVLLADVQGVQIDDLEGNYRDLFQPVLTSLVGVLVFALGARLVIDRHQLPSPAQARSESTRFSLRRLWIAHLISIAVNAALEDALRIESGLYQPLIAALAVKWAFLFLLAYIVLARRQGYPYLIISIVFEVVTGFGGFFSGFKTVFFIVLIGTLTARIRLTRGTTWAIALLIVPLLYLLVAWSAIKTDYRNFVSEGSGAQEVVVGASDRLIYLLDAYLALDLDDLQRGTERLLERISYVDFFAAVMDYVPAVEPHTDGAFTGQAIMHILTPRLFFPGKAPLRSDSDVTNQYTGLRVGRESEGTSISIGYMSEFYIDFGPIFMYPPIMGLGCLAGWMYCFLLTRRRGTLLVNYGFAVMVLFGLATFETVLIKLLGSLVTTFLLAWAIGRFVMPRVEWRLYERGLPRRPAVGKI
jgi:hypothetical protein